MLLLSYSLWSRFGREEDPERAALLEEIQRRLADGSLIAEEQGGHHGGGETVALAPIRG